MVTYNPLLLTAPDRLEDISQELYAAEVVGLPGTRLRATKLAFVTHKLRAQNVSKHLALHWGWSAAPFSNRSAGCSLLIGGRFRKSNVRATFSPPAALRGRGGAARITQGSVDFLVVLLYYQPPPQHGR